MKMEQRSRSAVAEVGARHFLFLGVLAFCSSLAQRQHQAGEGGDAYGNVLQFESRKAAQPLLTLPRLYFSYRRDEKLHSFLFFSNGAVGISHFRLLHLKLFSAYYFPRVALTSS